MSDFSTANEYASELVWGKHYQTGERCKKLNELILVRGKKRKVVPAPSKATHEAWGNIASLVQALLHDGWTVLHDTDSGPSCERSETIEGNSVRLDEL